MVLSCVYFSINTNFFAFNLRIFRLFANFVENLRIMEELRDRLRLLLRAKGINQVTLASRLGVTPATIHHYFDTDIRVSTLLRILSAAGIPPSDLFPSERVSDPPSQPCPQDGDAIVDGYISVNGFITHVTNLSELQQVTRQAVAMNARD